MEIGIMKIENLQILIMVALLVGCDGDYTDEANMENSVELDMRIRAPLALAGNAPNLEYQIFAGDRLLYNEVDRDLTEKTISISYEPGEEIYYRFVWSDENFNVTLATAENFIFPTGGQMTEFINWESSIYDDDQDGASNLEEYKSSTSPLSTKDSPGSWFMSHDERWRYMTSRRWFSSVFGCRSTGGNEWFWILNTSGDLGGVETNNGSTGEVEGRGSWFFYSFDEIAITNEFNETFDWRVSSSSGELNLVNASWGECVRLSGPSF